MAFLNFKIIACVLFLMFLIFTDICSVFAADTFYWWYQDNINKYVFPYSDDFSNWREMRKVKKAQRDNIGQIKRLYLVHGKFPLFQEQDNSLKKMISKKKLKTWVLDPDGNLTETALLNDKKGFYVLIPENLYLNGLYTLGFHLIIHEQDNEPNQKKSDRTIHYYARRCVFHINVNGKNGRNYDRTFSSYGCMSLEIAPMEQFYWQYPYREYEMEVLYKNRSVDGANVSIMTGSGWKKVVTTDSKGIFRVTPIESSLTHENRCEQYLYLTEYSDPETGEFHVSSFLALLYRDRQKNESVLVGLTLWAIFGTGLFLLIVGTMFYQIKKREADDMIIFDKYKSVRSKK